MESAHYIKSYQVNKLLQSALTSNLDIEKKKFRHKPVGMRNSLRNSKLF